MRTTAAHVLLAGMLLLVPSVASAQGDADRQAWVQLFNGKNLDGWVVKLAGHELGDNYADTFRVENGLLRVSYDKYGEYGGRFGHLFYRQKLSHYIIAVEYRFTGEQARGGPGYARLNSGVMIHSQAPETILKDQNWPISVEAQFLGNNPDDKRQTNNVCTPGTEIFMNGQMVKAHCTNSSSRSYGRDEWVRVEVEVLGSERVRHIIDGQTVLQYEKPQIGGGVVAGFDPAIKKDGTLLEDGYIGLQSESQPVDFRKVELLNLSGCMDPKAANFKSYYVHRDDAQCSGGASAQPRPGSVFLEELTWIEVRDAVAAGKTTVIIPTGGTEQNGPHMVLGKHNYLVEYKAGEIARRLGNALVAPVMAYVPEGDVDPPTGHMRYAGTITTPQDVYVKVLEYAARSFKQHGFLDVVLIGDSGGNQEGQRLVAAALNKEWVSTPVRVHHITAFYPGRGDDWVVSQGVSPEDVGTHAGTHDTASLMHLNPSMLRADKMVVGKPGDGQGHVGNPAKATALFGRRILEMQIDDATAQIRELRVSSR